MLAPVVRRREGREVVVEARAERRSLDDDRLRARPQDRTEPGVARAHAPHRARLAVPRRRQIFVAERAASHRDCGRARRATVAAQ